jgi:hypothetical protein
VTLVDGRVVTSHTESGLRRTLAATTDDEVDGGIAEPVGREEADLVRRWLASDGVRVRDVEGTLASPVAGGARLAAVRVELRAAERSARGDEVVLTRQKVRRRTVLADIAAERITPERDPLPT